MSHSAAELSLWNIVIDDASLQHAALELRAHLVQARVFEGRPAAFAPTVIAESTGAPSARVPTEAVIRLTAGSTDGDGFDIEVAEASITIVGASVRGTLNGVYWLLEQLGFLWVKPGEGGTRFVPGKSVATGTYAEAPAFRLRTLILGNDGLHDTWREWMEFASRNKVNDIFFHDTPPSRLDRAPGSARPPSAEEIAADGRGWMFELWDREGADILAAAKQRGIRLQFGGHHLPGLLPRELFAVHPDWFPMRNGERNPRYNLCTSSPGATAHVRVAARAFFERFRGADVYHLWADDIRGGGWCDCPDCKDLTPSDQALRATNLLAEVLEQVAPEAKIAHLAYHDTIEPPTGTPRENVVALYAPRPRNYAFAINDETCPRNARDHWELFRGLKATFRDPARIFVFEYYSDSILFKWMAPPLLGVLPADAQAYAGAGIGSFGNLAVTPRPWVGPNWHSWWWARCAWDPSRDAGEDLARFCMASYGEHSAAFERATKSMEQGYRLLLDLGELEQIARHDVLDFSDTPRRALAAKADQMRGAVPHFETAVRSLPFGAAELGMETRDEYAVQVSYALHLAYRVIAWDAALSGEAAAAGAALADARLALSAVNDWVNAHPAPGYANLSVGMLRAARWHTDRIAEMAGDAGQFHH